MKIAVIPDGAMMIIHLVTKNGHEYLSSTNLSEEKLRKKDPYDDSFCDYDAPPFSMKDHERLTGNKYASCETPSGLRGRMSMFDFIIRDADAAIIMGPRPKGYKHMYNHLNELILFSCVGCYNHYKLLIQLIKQKEIPILELAYPDNREKIICMIDRINDFLQGLHTGKYKNEVINDDNLNCDMRPYKKKISLNDLEKIINEFN